MTWSGGARNEQALDPRALLESATRGSAETLGRGAQPALLSPEKVRTCRWLQSIRKTEGFAGSDPAALLVYSTDSFTREKVPRRNPVQLYVF